MKIEQNGDFKNVKLGDIALNNSVIVNKVFEGGFEKEGKFGKFYTVNFEYKGERVGTIMTPKIFEQWKSLPQGQIKISRTAEEVEFTKGGKQQKKLINVYKMEAITASSLQQKINKAKEWIKNNNFTDDFQINFNEEVMTIADFKERYY